MTRPEGDTPPPPRKRRRWRPLASPLTRRILAVNLLAPIILVVGLLYLDRYKQALVKAEIDSLRTQAEMIAAAIGEGAVHEHELSFLELAREPAAQLVRRLAEPAGVRARLFAPQGDMVADSRYLLGAGGIVQVEDLPPPHLRGFAAVFQRLYGLAMVWLPSDGALPPYVEHRKQRAEDYSEVMRALQGEAANAVRNNPGRGMILSVSVPVQRYKQVVAAVMLSAGDRDIARSLFQVRLTIFQVFVFSLLVTVLLSFYLAGTIARPIRRLALAADHVRRGHGRRHHIPDLSARKDEIGELSGALKDMTEALWRRMDAIEAFAADVAHEIKNPLTSLRSAVETVARVTDPKQRDKLMAIIQDDVQRLDRLISDISDASRLDAELSRAETEPVSVAHMLAALTEVYRSTAGGGDQPVDFTLALPDDDDLLTPGIEGRLVQVFRNLIANAVSFSPPGGTIRLAAARDGRDIVVTVDDDGPGIPDNKLDAIFERFYSERPKSEKFGTHSGLGLSISKQIIDAHGGRVTAENRQDADGAVIGARFIVRLPALDAAN